MNVKYKLKTLYFVKKNKMNYFIFLKIMLFLVFMLSYIAFTDQKLLNIKKN